jgi:hypothetical protein
MSTNFNPQPPATGPSAASMHAPQRPRPPNVGGLYVATDAKQFYDGAVRFAAGTAMVDNFVQSAIRGGGVFGVVSFWVRWEPDEQTRTTIGWPRIGQNGKINMSQFFGTDPAHASMGSIDIELVPISGVAVEFAPGAT